MKRFILFLLFLTLLAPALPVAAATNTSTFHKLTAHGWLPYWVKDTGTDEARDHLSTLSSVSAFAYEVDAKGRLIDRVRLKQSPWPDFISDAQDADTDIYATIAWHNGEQIHDVLSSASKRRKHIANIAKVATSKIDGIDIDYESKLAETNPYFSTFLSELNKALDKKHKELICTIEARTPLEDRVARVTPEILAQQAYANDYRAINESCDVIRIMAYDQGRIDLKLNAAANAAGSYYSPIADPQWVRKVVQLALKDFSPDKVQLGIPTYGRVYKVTGGTYEYMRSLSYDDAIALAKTNNVSFTRNRSGEMSFMYTTSSTGEKGNYVAFFNDAQAIADKVAVAREFKLDGVVFWRIDGQSDPEMWNVFIK